MAGAQRARATTLGATTGTAAIPTLELLERSGQDPNLYFHKPKMILVTRQAWGLQR